MIDSSIRVVEEFVLGACMIVMASALFVTLMFRFVNIPIVGGEEIAEFSIVWMTFWGLALCARRGINISMSIFVDKLPVKAKKVMLSVICLITGVCCIYLAVLGAQLTFAVYSRGQITPALQIPIWYFYIAAPIGFALSGLYYLANVVDSLRTGEAALNISCDEFGI